jgi:hypothetical protein
MWRGAMDQQIKDGLIPKVGGSAFHLRWSMPVREPMTIEAFRRSVASTVIALYVVWVILGLIVFTVTGNLWLLISSPVLAYPLRRVVDYYFRERIK